MKNFNIQLESIKLNMEEISAFCESLRSKGRQTGTINAYHKTLIELYTFLPEDKLLTEKTLEQWITYLEEQNLSEKTIKHRIAVISSYLKYIGNRIESVTSNKKVKEVKLTRKEYHRLLSAAKILDSQKTYLLIKVFGTIGLPVQELDKLTVETVKSGNIFLGKDDENADYYIPKILQKELLDYAYSNGIYTGLIFTKKNGEAMRRTDVNRLIKNVCRGARVEEEKATPRCLKKMCIEAQNKIYSDFINVVHSMYDRMIESEQDMYGW